MEDAERIGQGRSPSVSRRSIRWQQTDGADSAGRGVAKTLSGRPIRGQQTDGAGTAPEAARTPFVGGLFAGSKSLVDFV
jgi:hypothetical protein